MEKRPVKKHVRKGVLVRPHVRDTPRKPIHPTSIKKPDIIDLGQFYRSRGEQALLALQEANALSSGDNYNRAAVTTSFDYRRAQEHNDQAQIKYLGMKLSIHAGLSPHVYGDVHKPDGVEIVGEPSFGEEELKAWFSEREIPWPIGQIIIDVSRMRDQDIDNIAENIVEQRLKEWHEGFQVDTREKYLNF